MYSTNNAKAIKDISGHSLTNMFYGDWKTRKSKMGVWVKNVDTNEYELANEYTQCTVYLMQRNSVYKASIKRAISSKK